MNPIRPIASVLALCALAFPLASHAAPPAARDASRQDVLIVIDAERNLALVPEGTILPEGLSVSFGMGDSPESATPVRQLVFAYAEEAAFAKARQDLAAAADLEPADEAPEARHPLETTSCFPRLATVYHPTGSWHNLQLWCTSQTNFHPALYSRLTIPADPYVEYPRINGSLRTSSPQVSNFNGSAAGASVNGSGAVLSIDRCCAYGIATMDIYSNASESIKYCQIVTPEPTVCNLYFTSQITFRITW